MRIKANHLLHTSRSPVSYYKVSQQQQDSRAIPPTVVTHAAKQSSPHCNSNVSHTPSRSSSSCQPEGVKYAPYQRDCPIQLQHRDGTGCDHLERVGSDTLGRTWFNCTTLCNLRGTMESMELRNRNSTCMTKGASDTSSIPIELREVSCSHASHWAVTMRSSLRSILPVSWIKQFVL